MSDTNALLDLLNVDDSQPDKGDHYPELFKGMSEKLMNDFVLMVNGHSYRLAEIEFYLTGGEHMDPFSHCDQYQKKMASWYFHRLNGGSYKAGTYKGLDLAFGNEKRFAGILIRAIRSEDGKEFVEGPCLVVNQILNLCSAASIDELVLLPNFHLSATEEDGLIYLKHSPKSTPDSVFVSPRFGLTLKKPGALKEEFIMRPYRYLTHPTLHKKGKHHIVVPLIDKLSLVDISRQTGATKTTIQACTDAYKEGKKKKNVNVGESNKYSGTDICHMYGAAVESGYVLPSK